MLKPIVTFSLAVLLCACAGVQTKQIPPQVRATKKVDFFASGHTQAAFKVVGVLSEAEVEGVLVIKKIGEEDFEVSVLTGGAYRVLQATLTPEGIAYQYLFPDADTPLVRSRISQFLNLLLLEPGVYQRSRTEGKKLVVTYKNHAATIQLTYGSESVYPVSAKTSTLLNKADLTYQEYAPSDSTGTRAVPHVLDYKDGKLEMMLTLISLK